MTNIEFSPMLRVALNNKRLADIDLLKLQQEIRNGNRAYTASALLSALEDCDDALEAVWFEARRSVREEGLLETAHHASPGVIQQYVLAETSDQPLDGAMPEHSIVSSAQRLVRELFAKTTRADVPHQNAT